MPTVEDCWSLNLIIQLDSSLYAIILLALELRPSDVC